MDKFSSCCGVPMNGAAQDYQRCPECKESCDAVGEEVVETKTIVVEMDEFKWLSIVAYFKLTNPDDYTVKEIRVKDELFLNDAIDKELGRAIHKAIEKRDVYRFNKRNNIKS
jgi:hypothetical protein